MSVVDHSSSARITADIVLWHPLPLASKDLLQLHKYMHPGLELLETKEGRKGRGCGSCWEEKCMETEVVHPEYGFQAMGSDQQLFPPGFTLFQDNWRLQRDFQCYAHVPELQNKHKLFRKSLPMM